MTRKKIAKVLPEALNYPKDDYEDPYYLAIAEQWIAEGFTSSMDVWDWIMAGYTNPKEAKFFSNLGVEAYDVDKLTLLLIKNIYKDKIEIKITENSKTIFLEYIRVVKEGEGTGTKVMTTICNIADMLGKAIELVPSSEFGSSYERLLGFYSRFGFRFKDSSVMYREPNKKLGLRKG